MKKRIYTVLLVTLIIGTTILSMVNGEDSVYANTLNSAQTVGKGQKIVFNVPNGEDNVDLVGILVKRYQSNTVNSTNESSYTNVVNIEGKTEWFVGTDQGVKSGGMTRYELRYDSWGVGKNLFSNEKVAEELGIVSHNMLAGNETFKMEVVPVYRLPDWRDLRGEKKTLFYKVDGTIIPGGGGGGNENDGNQPPFKPQKCIVEMSFQDGDILEGSNLTANPTGRIIEDELDEDSNKYNVLTYGIPSSERLMVQGESEKYLHDYHFQQRNGKVKYMVKVVQDFKLTWNNASEGQNTNMLRQENVFAETHDVSFWKIGHLLIYNFDDALFKNYALPDGEVAVPNNNMVVINTLHDNVDKNHVITKPCTDIYLGTKTLDGGETKPEIPDWRGEAQSKVEQGFNSRVPDVKNDRVQVDGTTNMNDSITRSHGPRPTAIPKAPMVKVSRNNLLISPTLQNRWKTPSSITSRYSAKTQVNKVGNDLQFIGTSPTKINEVTVHTPVVMYAKSTDDKAHDQRLDAPVRVGDPDSDRHAVVLDRPFTVTLPTSGQHLQTSMAPGYGKRDYRKYTKEKEVQFPFDVYSETKQAFYPKGTWVKVPVDQETASFFLPVWVPEGQYTVKFRSIAINATGVTPEEHHANLNMSYRTPNGSMANHVAYDTVKVDVVGRLYDFRITDVLDPNWEGVFRKINGLVEHTNKYYWSGLKGIDGGNRGNADPYTLPIRHGSHPKGYKNVSVKTGYTFRFDMKTKGVLWKLNDAVRVTPSFYFVNKDGSGRREVDVYYHNDSKKFIKVGSNEDTEYRSVKLNDPLRNVPNKQIRELGEYLYKYPTDYGYSSKVDADSRVKFLRDYERKYSKNSIVTGPYGWQMMSWGLRTFIGPDASTLPNGLQVTEDRAKASEQQWYGEYSLPSDLYVVEKGKSVSGYGLQHRMNKDSSLFLRDGYVIVNFRINSIKDGDIDNPDLGYGGGSGNQWELEGYRKSFTDAYGKNFNLVNGDVMFYHGDRSSRDDYGTNVIQ